MNPDRHARELRAEQAVDERRRVVRMQDVDALLAEHLRQLEAAEILAGAALVRAVDHRYAFGFHLVGERAANAEAADGEPEAFRIDVAAQVHDHAFHAADAHAERRLDDVDARILTHRHD